MALREFPPGPSSETWTSALAEVPRELWDRLHEGGRRLLLLDYDGTLAPFHVRPDQAFMPPRTFQLLRGLAESKRTSVALVSGRPISELEQLLGDPGPRVHWIGEHGWEERAPGGDTQQHPLSEEARLGLDGAWKAIDARGLQGRVEKKRASLVLHTRGLFPDTDTSLQRATEAVWLPWTERAPLRLDTVHGGLELRAVGRDKGLATLDLHRRHGDVSLVVYVGDDETDEDAFKALARARGFGIRVGPDEGPTSAHGRLPRPEAMDEFLARWLDSESIATPSSGARG